MNLDFSAFHPGHSKTVIPFGGHAMVICMTCGVAADLEAVSGKISAADAFLSDNKDRTLIGKMSQDVQWTGKVKP